MRNPRVKKFLRIYRRAGEPHLYLGIGPRKTRIVDPSDEMVTFTLALNGTRDMDSLRAEFDKADSWLSALDAKGVIEDAYEIEKIDGEVAHNRWSRQVNYLRLFDHDDWTGLEGMQRVRDARVVVLGTGAGGTTLLRLLNGLGVGTLEAIDFDTFAEENLPTHPTLDEADVGTLKLDALRKHLPLQNSTTRFITHDRRIEGPDDIAALIDGADFFFNAYDRPRNYAIRWSNEASIRTGVPMAQIGVTDKGARVGPMLIPGVTPCMNCIGIHDLEVLRAEESGSLNGAIVSMIAGIAVNEVVSLIAGAKTSSMTAGRVLYVDTAELDFTFTPFEFSDNCDCRERSADRVKG